MSGTLSPSGLRWNDPGDTSWLTDENNNIIDLNDDLLKISALDDFSGTPEQDHILKYNSGTGDFESTLAEYGYETITTTTTSTTSSTTTTT